MRDQSAISDAAPSLPNPAPRNLREPNPIPRLNPALRHSVLIQHL